MERPRPDRATPIPEIEAPAFLREKRSEMQARAPYRGLGFRKTRLESAVHRRLLAHWQASAARFQPEHAIDEIGNADTGTIPTLVFDDRELNAELAKDLQPLHEAWAGVRLELSACYGIRVYQRGTFLYTHVDRPTHVVSSTICVDHALDQRWPLQVESVEGAVSQIDVDPGELVLYEGARLAHGRPYPLHGEYYACMFVHYRPAGSSPPRPEPV